MKDPFAERTAVVVLIGPFAERTEVQRRERKRRVDRDANMVAMRCRIKQSYRRQLKNEGEKNKKVSAVLFEVVPDYWRNLAENR